VDTLALVFAIAAMLSWALNLLLMKVGVDRMDWIGFGMLRPWMSLPFVALFAWLTGGFTFGSIHLVLIGIGGGLLNAVFGTACYYYALSKESMHKVNILANTNPFWGVVSSILFLHEPARAVTFGAGALVLGGTFFLVRRGNDATQRRSLVGSFSALVAGAAWGFSSTVPTKICLSGGMSPIAYQLLFTSSAAVGWTLVALPRLRAGRLHMGRKDLWVAFGSSMFGMFIGWVFWLLALDRANASVLSPLISLTLLFAGILGVVVLKERVTRRILVGGALVIAGVVLVSVLGN